MQIWPEFKNFPLKMRRAATGMFAPGSTTVGDFPPSSSVTGVKNLAAASMTMRPTAPFPVKTMWSQRKRKSAVASGTPPVMTAMASGSTYFGNSCASRASVLGASSEGFSSTQFPAAKACAVTRSDNCTGKFQGAMFKTTPFGSRTMSERPGCCKIGVDTPSGAIHFAKCFNMKSISPIAGAESAIKASIRGRPRSAWRESQTASAFSTIIRLTPSSCAFRQSKGRVFPERNVACSFACASAIASSLQMRLAVPPISRLRAKPCSEGKAAAAIVSFASKRLVWGQTNL
mmetsp:Transcript_126119/g.247255  ORF Transcript_126119/g.247255 Transcript_126119/m.247255 type:complete len:288 (-) Transcript_126119:8-871(-)